MDWDYLELLPANALVALGHERLSVVSGTGKRMGRKEILYSVVAKWPNTKNSLVQPVQLGVSQIGQIIPSSIPSQLGDYGRCNPNTSREHLVREGCP